MLGIKIGTDTGGKEAIQRLIEAYGFTTKQALCDHLHVSKSTMANRYLRDSFPADWVIQCALETGASLLWLATGQGESFPDRDSKKTSRNETLPTIKHLQDIVAPSLPKFVLANGEMHLSGQIIFDSSLIPSQGKDIIFVQTDRNEFLVDEGQSTITNGFWLISIDGLISVSKLTRIPGNKVIVSDSENSFECALSDIDIKGRVVLTLVKS
ncbi:phage repressor protein CI [Atlantibacter subterranea]|uniref:Phage repressor protein CI n=1 Tax=Atlantibacter subterraneus TaxID=255519 RepID=A0ABU4E2P2_9ENTR|nr:phage repressor protein CI [Atlantibacter subterranea]MDV7023346.1 phage repressor protein CI [Atlantibacter subterranea]MDZ5666360.1 phage repressor protein CI [Atlantibacter hermannii]